MDHFLVRYRARSGHLLRQPAHAGGATLVTVFVTPGASRLHQQYSPGNGTKPSAAFCKLKNQSSHDSHIGLKNMYASNQEVHYEFAAVAMPERNRSLPVHREKDSSSEVALAVEERYGGHSPDAAIRVQTKWNVSHG